MEQGIYENFDIVAYHKSEGISSSGITLLLNSPAKYHYEYCSNLIKEKQDTKSLIIGQAVHTAILEPHLFASRFVSADIDRRTKKGKDTYEYILSSGKQHLKIEEMELAKNMAQSAHSHPKFKTVFENGKVENSLFWKHENGITLRSRPDFYNNFMVVDIKTTNDANPKVFQKSLVEYGYHRQAAMALDGLTKLTKKEYKFFTILAIEKDPPYLCCLYLLDQTVIEKGREEYNNAAEIYKNCLEKNEWPGYSQNIQDLYLPNWYN